LESRHHKFGIENQIAIQGIENRIAILILDIESQGIENQTVDIVM